MQDWEIGSIKLPMLGAFFKVRPSFCATWCFCAARPIALCLAACCSLLMLFFPQPIYYIQDSGGVTARVVGRTSIHHNVTMTFKIQEQRAGRWLDVGSLERRCSNDPVKAGSIGAFRCQRGAEALS